MHRLDCGGSKSERNLWKSFFSRLLCDGTTCAQAHYEKNNKGGNITCKIIKYQRWNSTFLNRKALKMQFKVFLSKVYEPEQIKRYCQIMKILIGVSENIDD